MLNVVILEWRDGGQFTVRADVRAQIENLVGQRRPISMRAIEENGRTSYLGEFEVDPLRNFRFTITAQPQGTQQRLALDFKDRLVARDR